MPASQSGPLTNVLECRSQAASLRNAVLRIMFNIVEDLEEVLDATANLSLPAARAWRAEFRAAKRKVERENPNMASEFQVRSRVVSGLLLALAAQAPLTQCCTRAEHQHRNLPAPRDP